MSSPPPSPQRSLTTIPSKLQLSIASHLDPMSHYFFRNANSHFRNLLPPLTHRQLFAAENSPYARYHTILACSVCLRLRPKKSFATDRLTKFDSLLCSDRFCIDCSSRLLTNNPEEDYDKFPFGARWNVDGKEYGRCARCKECKPGSWRPGYWLQEVCGECEPLDEMERMVFGVVVVVVVMNVMMGREEMKKRVAANEAERREEVEFYQMKSYWPSRC